ncbi:hypothetical protein pb186bvf_002711 [Paramecium bursaria]
MHSFDKLTKRKDKSYINNTLYVYIKKKQLLRQKISIIYYLYYFIIIMNIEYEKPSSIVSVDDIERKIEEQGVKIEYGNKAPLQLSDVKEGYLYENQAQQFEGGSNLEQEMPKNEIFMDKHSGSYNLNDLNPDQNVLKQQSQIHQFDKPQIKSSEEQVQILYQLFLTKFQEYKRARNKLEQIKDRTINYTIYDDSIRQFMKLFVGIKFPACRNIFEQFNRFKIQLNGQYYNQCQCCKTYLVDISLTLTKYHLINLEFQDQARFANQLTPIDFLKDILLLLDYCYNEYSDLLKIVQCFMRGQEIQNLYQDLKRWKNFASLFEKQLLIERFFYIRHNYIYRNFIQQSVYRKELMDEKWFYLNDIFKGQRQFPRVVKKHFIDLMLREKDKQQQGVSSNIGFFTLIVLFEQIKQNEKLNSLICADDIFNLIFMSIYSLSIEDQA